MWCWLPSAVKSGEAGRYVASFVVIEVDIIFGSTLSALFTFLM